MGDRVQQRVAHVGIEIGTMERRKAGKTSSSNVTTHHDGSSPISRVKGDTGDLCVTDAQPDQEPDAKILHLGGVGRTDRQDRGRDAEIVDLAHERGRITTVDIVAHSPEGRPAGAAVLPHADDFIDEGVTGCVPTPGGDGAWRHREDGTRFDAPAIAIDVRAACGDAFDAGFAPGMRHGVDPQTTIRFARAMSASNATGLGSRACVTSFARTLEFVRTTPVR